MSLARTPPGKGSRNLKKGEKLRDRKVEKDSGVKNWAMAGEQICDGEGDMSKVCG